MLDYGWNTNNSGLAASFFFFLEIYRGYWLKLVVIICMLYCLCRFLYIDSFLSKKIIIFFLAGSRFFRDDTRLRALRFLDHMLVCIHVLA